MKYRQQLWICQGVAFCVRALKKSPSSLVVATVGDCETDAASTKKGVIKSEEAF